MEDLTDAIQDARYLKAVYEEDPRPTRNLETSPTSFLHEYYLDLKANQPQVVSFEGVLKEPIGYYLFLKYLKKENDHMAMLFVEDVQVYKVISRPSLRLRYAKQMVSQYLNTSRGATPGGPPDIVIENQHSSEHLLHSMGSYSNIPLLSERVLKPRPYHFQRPGWNLRSALQARLNEPALTMMSRAFFLKYEDPHSLIGLGGLPIKRIVDVVDGMNEKPTPGGTTRALSSTIFDTVRDAVLEGVYYKHWEGFNSSHLWVEWVQFKVLEHRQVSAGDFTSFRILGRGGFGAVLACKKQDTGKVYAVKSMDKRRIEAKNATELCWNERVVLSRVDSPFVVGLQYAFQSKHDLFLVMDLMSGGDLSYHLSLSSRFSEHRARFYAAEILLGLEHLHSLGIVYRDLKPENILLDKYGHCKISDMGLATHMAPYLSGRCGTRGYWAPEMLIRVKGRRQPYDFTVDWWSFGCVLYEFISGKCPFRTDFARTLDRNKHKSMDLATLHMKVPYDRKYFSEEAIDLLQRLLCRSPGDRLGAQGSSEVKEHPFFQSIDWGLLSCGMVDPPYVPEKNINAAPQNAIGLFEEKTRGVELLEQEYYKRWDAVNRISFQTEIVELQERQDYQQQLKKSEGKRLCRSRRCSIM